MASEQDWVRYGDELRRPLLMARDLPKSTKVCVVGGGLSGLTVAYRIATKRPDLDVELIEKSDRLGGVIETWTRGDWVCDIAVNATRAHPAFWRLVDDLGLGDRFAPSNPEADSRWIFTQGRSQKLSLWTVLKRGPFKLLRGLRTARRGRRSVADALPLHPVNDAMTLGIVNDRAANVDADFLMPSMTRFGADPPIKWKRIKAKMDETYPLFQPKRGATASFEGGMQTLVHALEQALNRLDNVALTLNADATAPKSVAQQRGVPVASVVWCAPLDRPQSSFTTLNVYVAGYGNDDVAHVPVGYGTLIPDLSSPISGILHESDVHGTSRAPDGHRLFRIMSPTLQTGSHETVKAALAKHLGEAEPVVFEHIGVRSIPSYPPGYMDSLSTETADFTRAGWCFSGVSVTHVVAEAERIANHF